MYSVFSTRSLHPLLFGEPAGQAAALLAKSREDDMQDVENLLESYFMMADNTYQRLVSIGKSFFLVSRSVADSGIQHVEPAPAVSISTTMGMKPIKDTPVIAILLKL